MGGIGHSVGLFCLSLSDWLNAYLSSVKFKIKKMCCFSFSPKQLLDKIILCLVELIEKGKREKTDLVMGEKTKKRLEIKLRKDKTNKNFH